MRSFKDYAKQTEQQPMGNSTIGEERDEQAFGKSFSQSAEQDSQMAASAEELTKRIARTYNGKSNASMLKNILMEAEKSKRAGTLTNAEIEAFYQNFAPMLNATQKRQLRAVVDKLKQI